MAAVTRWVEYLTSAEGSYGTGEAGVYGAGTQGRRLATASVGDSFNIGSTNNRLYLTLDGVPVAGNYITLASGSDLDPRFVAKDIGDKLRATGGAIGVTQGQAYWVNDDSQSHLEVASGNLGSNSSAVVSSGVNTAHLELGFGTSTAVNGVSLDPDSGGTNGYNGGVLVSGTYNGFFDEIYKVVIGATYPVNTPVQGGSNSYTGAITAGGAFDHNVQIVYVIDIDTTNGTTMGAGTGNVPTMAWDTGAVDDSTAPIELLYADYWYNVGTKGLMVKFSDAVFNTVDPAWTITCDAVTEASPGNATSPLGTARYFYASNRGDISTAFTQTAASGTYTDLGNRGLEITFNGTNNMTGGDTFYVVCTPPAPTSYDISNLNYGNVTVSTESTVKSVIFEIMSGAVEIDTVKFGLQDHGTFSHHNEGNSDTLFRFGTVGPGNTAGTGNDVLEWRANVTAADISSDTPPSYLFATEDNLSVVTDADSSEAVGTSTYMGMVADPLWLNIKLGTSEVGANSTINYRIYFDYS